MRKQLFSWAAAALSVVALNLEAQAQSALSLIGGARFKVVAPANLAGSRRFTYSYTGSAPWGGDLSTPIINTQVIQALGTDFGNTDSLLCTPAANGTGSIPSLAGKVAIFYRGNCTFSSKANTAEAAGAVAAIIINNVPGEPAGMAATAGINVTIPVFMISDVDGAALMAAIRNGVDTRVTFTQWGSGLANDVAVISNFEATYHGGAIPKKQLASSNNNPRQYRMYTGDVVANFGTDTSKGIVIKNEVSWMPTGSSTSTVVYTDTAQLTSLAPEDSVDRVFSTRFFNPHTTSTGIYTVKNTLSNSIPEADTVDNVNTYEVYVTDSIYSKTLWDATNMRPAFTGASRLNTGGLFSWGPLFYTAFGGDYPAKMQFTLAKDAGAVFAGESATAAAFKFDDGANGNPVDGIFQDGELSLQAVGYKAFGVNDTASYTTFEVGFDPAQLSQPIPALMNNSTYWYAISPSQGTFFIATNGNENPYMRTFVSKQVDTTEYFAPQFLGSATLIPSGVSSSDFRMLPFLSLNGVPVNNIDSAGIDQTSGTPAMSLHVSTFSPNAVRNTETLFETLDVFPNPAKDNLTVRWASKKAFGLATITVFNGVGQQVMNYKTYDLKGDHNFSLTNLASGNYWVVFGTEKGVDTRQIKIIK